jgi:hypothetical protein
VSGERRTRFFRGAECPAQVACEGGLLLRGRTICGKCEKAIKRRNAGPEKLRGEPTQYELNKKRSA